MPEAEGVVLEIGMGSGENLPYYDPKRVKLVYGLEPSEGMRALAEEKVERSGLLLEWLPFPGEAIPLEDNRVDTVLLTYTLCTIPDRSQALREMKRVLKPGGRLLFCEHGLAPDASVAKLQRLINPLWSPLAGGCRIDLPMVDLILNAGFVIDELNSMYLPSTPRPFGYNVWGKAFAKEAV